MKALVAIANYGDGNRGYLEQIISSYQKMPIDVSVVVLSNVPKNFGNKIEVKVGLPTTNPRSLPFAHRTLFKERIDEYDIFIYSEDDTLLTWATLAAFVESLKILPQSEIAGFLRTETDPDGRIYFSSCHSFFRWLPSSVRQRGNKLWAKYSNEHSALFIASREQLQRAIASGGFCTKPHEGRFEMLESAATDIYTRCGLERLICIDRIEGFTLSHLPNKYINLMGISEEEVYWQIEALRKIHEGYLSDQELIQPETFLPGGMGSKQYHELQDPILSRMIEGSKKRILVWGSGDGYFESQLENNGNSVAVLPIDAVMGECCRNRGLEVFSLEKEDLASDGGLFDYILMRDILHLVESPERVVNQVRKHLCPGGRILLRVPNFHNARMIKNRLKNNTLFLPWTRERIGAIPFTNKSLKKLVAGSGFGNIEAKSQPLPRFKGFNRMTLGFFTQRLSPGIYMRAKKV